MKNLAILPILTGALLGVIAPILVYMGNPGNMGFCAACFLRDTSGAFGFHQVAALQYIRPEILGLIIGGFVAAVFSKQFSPSGGSSPFVRFLLGIFAMIGALIFLGCPWRAFLRLGGGDLTAIAGVLGLFFGIWGGTFFHARGYSLGETKPQSKFFGMLPFIISVLLLMAVWTGFKFGENMAFFSSVKGPGSMHPAVVISVVAGILIGIAVQRSKFCTTRAFRELIMDRKTTMLQGVVALIIAATITNIALSQYKLSFEEQPIAHGDFIWNFLGMALAGLCFVLGGGCPGKQLVSLGEGNGDSAVFITGMMAGAAIAHNFALAASPKGITEFAPYAVVLGLVFCVFVGFAGIKKNI